MSINYKLIGRRVKEAHLRRELSQAMLAEFTDLSTAFIRHIETVKRQASLESLVRISNVLNITVDYLLAGNQAKENGVYGEDLMWILKDCSQQEKQFLVELAASAKEILHKNRALLNE